MSTDEEYKIDPYGCLMTDTVKLLNLAIANQGRMNDYEFATVQAIKALLIERDPDLNEAF